MPHKIYISSDDDLEIVREAIAWSGLKPEEITEAMHALDRVMIHLVRARGLLEEAHYWLTSPAKFPKEDFGDFLERYQAFKTEEKQIEK